MCVSVSWPCCLPALPSLTSSMLQHRFLFASPSFAVSQNTIMATQGHGLPPRPDVRPGRSPFLTALRNLGADCQTRVSSTGRREGGRKGRSKASITSCMGASCSARSSVELHRHAPFKVLPEDALYRCKSPEVKPPWLSLCCVRV